MRLISAFGFCLILLSVGIAQEISPEQKLRQIKELSSQIDKAVQELLVPSAADLKDAEAQEAKAFRLMPREIYGRQIPAPVDGAFFSFTTGSHDYQKIAQILLEQNKLRTGFAGADYGLIGDLGKVPLSEVKSEIPEVDFLLKCKAPANILNAWVEQRRTMNMLLRASY